MGACACNTLAYSRSYMNCVQIMNTAPPLRDQKQAPRPGQPAAPQSTEPTGVQKKESLSLSLHTVIKIVFLDAVSSVFFNHILKV